MWHRKGVFAEGPRGQKCAELTPKYVLSGEKTPVKWCRGVKASQYRPTFQKINAFFLFFYFVDLCVGSKKDTRAGPTTKCTSLEVVPTDSSLPKNPCLVKSAPHSKVPWSARGLIGEKKKTKKNKKEFETWRERHRTINHPTGHFKHPRKQFSHC